MEGKRNRVLEGANAVETVEDKTVFKNAVGFPVPPPKQCFQII